MFLDRPILLHWTRSQPLKVGLEFSTIKIAISQLSRVQTVDVDRLSVCVENILGSVGGGST